jgi:hypothetical protein
MSNAKVIQRPGLHLVVEYHARAVAEPDVETFVAGLVEMLDAGQAFHPGQTFRMGWSTLRFVDAGDGTLALEELDGSGVAAQWARGVSRTLIATRLQTSVIESFSIPADLMDFPDLNHSSIICTDVDPDGALFMHRLEPTHAADTGWFFSCQFDDHDHNDPRLLQADSLYVHACRIQAVLPFLAMPVGSRILLAADGAVEEAGGPVGKLSIVPGSYLAERRGKTSRA